MEPSAAEVKRLRELTRNPAPVAVLVLF